MTTLHLGVNEIPYTGEPVEGPKEKIASGTQTTGDVASFLEKKYGLMQAFFDNKENVIAEYVEGSIAGALEDIISGAPPQQDPFAEGSSEVEALFKKFLTEGQVERLGIPGIPTKASLDRRAGKGKKYGSRGLTSFVDTGTYESSFRAWVDEK